MDNNSPPGEPLRTPESGRPTLIAGFQILSRWTSKGPGRFVLFGILVTTIASLVAVLSLSYYGFCFGQRRFLSDAEYFNAVIDEVLQAKTYSFTTYQQGTVSFNSVKAVQYRDKQEFLELNPNCCKIVLHNVGDQGPYTSFSDRVFGRAAKIVSATFNMRHLDDNGNPQNRVGTGQYAVTNCGRAWSARH